MRVNENSLYILLLNYLNTSFLINKYRYIYLFFFFIYCQNRKFASRLNIFYKENLTLSLLFSNTYNYYF